MYKVKQIHLHGKWIFETNKYKQIPFKLITLTSSSYDNTFWTTAKKKKNSKRNTCVSELFISPGQAVVWVLKNNTKIQWQEAKKIIKKSKDDITNNPTSSPINLWMTENGLWESLFFCFNWQLKKNSFTKFCKVSLMKALSKFWTPYFFL